MAVVAVHLIENDGFFESLCQVDAVERQLSLQMVAVEEHLGPVEGLPMDESGQVEQELLAREVIEPQHHLQVVASALFTPERPVPQRLFWQLGELIAEIAGEKRRDALVARRLIVLLQNLEHHHTRPPVLCIVALHSLLVGAVGDGTELSVLLL